MRHGRAGISRAVFGGGVWVLLVTVLGGGRNFFETIELLFILAPLLVVPLGFRLAGVHERNVFCERWAYRIQPLAAGLAGTCFWFPTGWSAALVASAWLLVTILVGLSGFVRFCQNRFATLEESCLGAGLLFLPVGGGALVLSRFGATPLDYVEPVVLLTAVHFHYAGFAGPIIVGTMARHLGRFLVPPALRFFQVAAVGVITATPLLAVGFILRWPWLKIVAAFYLEASLLILCVLIFARLPGIRPRIARVLLAFSAGSLVAGMLLAGMYSVGEFTEEFWISIPRMTRTHGFLNALGFTLCGLVGWVLVDLDSLRRYVVDEGAA